MQRQSQSDGQVTDYERVLRSGPVMAHYRHIQNGRSREAKCDFCTKGLDGIVATVEKEVAPADVAKDNRGNQEGATSPASDSGEDDWEE